MLPSGRRAMQPRPALLACFVGDLVVADLEEHMRQPAALAMHGDRVVGDVVNGVGLVVGGGDRRIGRATKAA